MSTTPEQTEDRGLLRFLTCGNVDDGKSTLIGRLLYDTRTILADALHVIEQTSKRRGAKEVDLSLITDGLQAEREQGITIDVAYRYFSTGTRKYIIADTPGHEQYTRNMVTGASTANLAIILIDARKGVQTQTRRHAYLAHLLGIPHVVIAINKMDLSNYQQQVFEDIKADYLNFADQLDQADTTGYQFIPLCALNGDMVVERGSNMEWYEGPTLLEHLEKTPAAHCEHAEPFRFPVQYVCRPKDATDPKLHDFRGFMGQVESGSIQVGDPVKVLPSEQQTRLREIRLGEQTLDSAYSEQSVTLVLEDEIDVSRGNMIVKLDDAEPKPSKSIEAIVCWFSERPLDPARTYLVRHTTHETKAKIAQIDYKLDINTLEQQPAEKLIINDIAKINLKLAKPLFIDPYSENRATGAFILIDESNNNTIGAGMIIQGYS